jgi:hypothetical protein
MGAGQWEPLISMRYTTNRLGVFADVTLAFHKSESKSERVLALER